MLVEGTTGILTGSLALVADAGHMLADVAGLSLALGAVWFARRPSTARRSFGYYRVEILAAVLNSLLLFAVAGYILFEAYERFREPPEVPGAPLLLVASLGLGVNLLSASLLWRGAGESLNVRGAFLEVIGDVLGSAGAIAAGIVLLTTGWPYADPLFAAGVSLLILPRTWILMRDAVDILLEATPPGIDLSAIQMRILTLPDVSSVHDLHVWSITSGYVALSAHVGVTQRADTDALLITLRRMLWEEFKIDHSTLQMESKSVEHALELVCVPSGAVPLSREVTLNPSDRARAGR